MTITKTLSTEVGINDACHSLNVARGHLLSAPTAAATTVKESASFTTSADRSRVRRQPRGPATAGISQPPFPLTTIFTWIVIFVADSMS